MAYTRSNYKGRFAPSPSGGLHLGSLTTALASFLDARIHTGSWLIRIEDIDPPREVDGAAAAILECLSAHGMCADEPVIFQSTQSQLYEQTLQSLRSAGLIYPCQCSRKRLSSLRTHNGNTPVYDGYCKRNPPRAGEEISTALRLDMTGACAQLNISIDKNIALNDQYAAPHTEQPKNWGDMILRRKDGYYSYNLAMVCDDIAAGITRVVRGDDLLEMSLQQNFLRQLFGSHAVEHLHIPVVLGENGLKLSKQNHAPIIENHRAVENLLAACAHLKLYISPELSTVSDVLSNAETAWRAQRRL